jgi:ADP-ribose pyrophosphatase YjhB (NUDIX family)
MPPFNYCPACGAAGITFKNEKEFSCGACGFGYFHNVATAAGVILESSGRVLCLTRAAEPGLGLLALPGGFVDPGERAEDAAARECLEETGINAVGLEFFGSYPNSYNYSGVRYSTCDLIFRARPRPDSLLAADGLPLVAGQAGEVAAAEWIMAAELDPGRFAFSSIRKALTDWLTRPNVG